MFSMLSTVCLAALARSTITSMKFGKSVRGSYSSECRSLASARIICSKTADSSRCALISAFLASTDWRRCARNMRASSARSAFSVTLRSSSARLKSISCRPPSASSTSSAVNHRSATKTLGTAGASHQAAYSQVERHLVRKRCSPRHLRHPDTSRNCQLHSPTPSWQVHRATSSQSLSVLHQDVPQSVLPLLPNSSIASETPLSSSSDTSAEAPAIMGKAIARRAKRETAGDAVRAQRRTRP
mmetsp:Transcript_4905/g.14302  ORF Transcript_4905/g.14302 Transcript_4905/m.14302 type:complete len:242 (-) Transcript_4905:60-785(-)